MPFVAELCGRDYSLCILNGTRKQLETKVKRQNKNKSVVKPTHSKTPTRSASEDSKKYESVSYAAAIHNKTKGKRPLAERKATLQKPKRQHATAIQSVAM